MTSPDSHISALVDNPLLVRGDELVSVDPEQVDHVDCLPAYADIALGDDFTYIGFDDDNVLQRLRDEGLSEPQIAAQYFRFSAETPDCLGVYKAASQQVVLYPVNSLSSERSFMKSVLGNTAKSSGRISDALWYLASISQSKVLYHEIRHARQHVVDKEMVDTNARYYDGIAQRYRNRFLVGAAATTLAALSIELLASRSKAATHLGAAVIAIGGAFISHRLAERMMDNNRYDDYRNNPIEIDAYSAEDDAPGTAVIVSLRDQSVPVQHAIPGVNFLHTSPQLAD